MNDAAAESASMEELLKLIGEEVCILAAEWPRDPSATGDIDCAVKGLDQQWPLRLPADCRLIHLRNYDINSWAWTIERNGKLIPFDCVEDPRGIARYKFPTALIRCYDGRLPSSAVRAAYLTIKRLRKDTRRNHDWEAIAALARYDRFEYETILVSLLGRASAGKVLTTVNASRVPGSRLRLQALSILWFRRFRNPRLALQAALKGSTRWVTRLTHPTGLVVAVAGPDGSGKSTLATQLPVVCAGGVLFLRHMHAHWRPGLLPPLGSLICSQPGDPTKPHQRPRHGPLVSAMALAYYWLDFFLGELVLFAPLKARSGLIVLERGWWDICVDPERYRIKAPPWILKAMGHLLVQPNLIIVLEAEPDVLMARKAEVDRDELVRLSRAWREVLPRRVKRAYIDASAPTHEVRAAAREAVLSALSDRAAGRLGTGWIGLPTRSSPRLILPRGPRNAALSAFLIYQPTTLKTRLGWEVGRGLAAAGLLRFFPRGEAPPESVRTAVAQYVPPRSTLSVLRVNHPGRFLASIVGPDGRLHGVAKLATNAAGREALEREANNIERYASSLERPLRAPRILERAPGLLLLEPIRWIPRSRPSVLPKEVAHSLGLAFARWSSETAEAGAAHGDCAPWNLLKSHDGWVLVDWEEAGPGAPPFYDVVDYIIQAHVLLGTPSLEELIRDDPAPRWVSDAIAAYAAGSGQPVSSWRPHFGEYLRISAGRLDPSDPAQTHAITVRQRLLRATEG